MTPHSASFPPPGAPPAGPWSSSSYPREPGLRPSAPLEPRPLRNRLATLLLLAAILAILGLGALGMLGAPPGMPLTPVAEAAGRTATLPGARFAGTARVLAPDGATLMTMPMRGSYDGESGRSFVHMRYEGLSERLPPAFALVEPVFVGVQDRGAFYMRSPLFAGQVPGGAGWIKIDFGELGITPEEAGGVNARSVLGSISAAGGEIAELGSERVRGARTTHYAATIAPEPHAEFLRTTGNDLAADVVEAQDSSSEIEVWIDGRERVRRAAMSEPWPCGGEGAWIQMTVEFFDFGAKPGIEVPPEAATFDATELGRQSLESLGANV